MHNKNKPDLSRSSDSEKTPRSVLGVIALFSAALLGVWLIPGNASQAQNREPTQFPEISESSFLGAETYRAVDAAIRDRIGAQVGVAHLVGELSAGVLGKSPSTRVIITSDGQPFFADDFTRPCRESEDSLEAVRTQLSTDAESFGAAGKYLLYVVAPDKSSIRRSLVNELSPDLMRCSDFVRAHFEAWDAEADIPLVTLWSQVETIDATPGGAYLFNDTHWNASGSTAMTSAVLQELVNSGEAPAAILDDLQNPVSGPSETFIGDLNGMMGRSQADQRSQLSFTRQGVVTTTETTTGPEGTARYHSESTSTTAPLVPGRTLVLGDSFTFSQLTTQLPNFFEDVTIADHYDYLKAGDFDRVIVERVQRDSTTDGWPRLTETLR